MYFSSAPSTVNPCQAQIRRAAYEHRRGVETLKPEASPEAKSVLHGTTIIFVLLIFVQAAASQVSDASGGEPARAPLSNALFDYLNVARGQIAADFKPMTQSERHRSYAKSLINPIMYLKAGLSGAIDQANDKPHEWEQGGAGYGKRVANITAQYGIQRTVTFGIASMIHEDNRYFGSGKKGFWPRTGYAISSSVLARHDNGKRYPSVSLIGGFAAAAFISRSWQPPSTHSAGDGASSFGFSMGYNVLACTVKEFLPDLLRPLAKRHKASAPPQTNAGIVK
jgi:hypothetical protein